MGQKVAKENIMEPKKQWPKGKVNIAVNEKDMAVLELKLVAADIKKSQRELERSCATLMARAKELHDAGKADRALTLMRLRKVKQVHAVKLEGQLATVQRTLDEVEWAVINKEIFTNLKLGAQTLKRLNDEIPIVEVERILESTQSALDKEREMSALLGASVSSSLSSTEEEELEKELMLLQGLANPSAPSLHQASTVNLNLPEVPTSPVLPARMEAAWSTCKKIVDEREADAWPVRALA